LEKKHKNEAIGYSRIKKNKLTLPLSYLTFFLSKHLMIKKQMAILQFDIDDALDSPILQMLVNLVLPIKKVKID